VGRTIVTHRKEKICITTTTVVRYRSNPLRKEIEMGTQLETMQEHEAIEFYHQMSSKFGWVGCIFTVADIRMRLAEDGLTGDELEAMVEKVEWTRWWRKVMDEAMCEAGYEMLDEAIREAQEGETK
jgi:hypothetical protein